MIASLSKVATALAQRMIGAGVPSIKAQWIAHLSDDVAKIASKGAKVTRYEADRLKQFSKKVAEVDPPIPEVRALKKQADDIAMSFVDEPAAAVRSASRNVPLEQITGQARWNQARDVYGNKV